MKMSERRAAAAARIKALETQVAQPALPAHVTYLGERNGKPHYRVIPTIERTPSGAERMAAWAEAKAEQHKAGGICPHCKGTGRYHLYTQPGSNGKCFRCDGKGRLNAKDLAFLNRRLGGKGPICWVVSAAAA